MVISTIQRVYAAWRGEQVPDVDDPGLDGFIPDAPVEVTYRAQLPPEAFDLIIVDEAHRFIYGVWRGVLEYFDAHIVGLTATPVKQTFAFFQQNLVSEYTYPPVSRRQRQRLPDQHADHGAGLDDRRRHRGAQSRTKTVPA